MRRTPVITLLAGLALAAGLLIVNTSLNIAPPPKAPAPSPPLSPSPSPTVQVNATWAARLDGATLAISVKDGVAVAYLCDGKRTEAWLQGTAADGKLSLSGKDGSTLTGVFGNGKATGSITANGRTWAFTAETVTKPSGLYRATAQVRNATVTCGWIVLADGTQVGVCNAAPAPKLNTTDGTAVVDGVTVRAS